MPPEKDPFTGKPAEEMPVMHIWTTPTERPLHPETHELQGWEDLDKWGRRNHPLWSIIRRRCDWSPGMSEIDKLRLLAGEMLRMNVELERRYTELVSQQIPPLHVILPPGTQLPHEHERS
jgi:hypothetical protein